VAKPAFKIGDGRNASGRGRGRPPSGVPRREQQRLASAAYRARKKKEGCMVAMLTPAQLACLKKAGLM
jgi:hypothetical protein